LSGAAEVPVAVAPAAPDTAIPRHVYLIDGSGFIFRAFHALPWLSRSDGTPTNAVYGFTNMLLNSPKQYESVLQVANRNTEFVQTATARYGERMLTSELQKRGRFT
jgi:hypothetical protein